MENQISSDILEAMMALTMIVPVEIHMNNEYVIMTKHKIILEFMSYFKPKTIIGDLKNTLDREALILVKDLASRRCMHKMKERVRSK